MAPTISLPLPLVKPNVLRSLASVPRYAAINNQEWQNVYLYMACRMFGAVEEYIENHKAMSESKKARFFNLLANELSWALTVASVAEARYPTLWKQPIFSVVLKALCGPDPYNPDMYRTEPMFSSLRLVYLPNTELWWHGDYETGFSRLDQVIKAFQEDRTAKLDWDEAKYKHADPPFPDSMTREEHIRQGKMALGYAMALIDETLVETKEKMREMTSPLGQNPYVEYEPVEKAVELGLMLGNK
ncbi:hypothetical protein NMY22_g7989 [Coprinellus aureogranulatus]|nr:hypothetical protein NMY22_g7989 [Coprinellus aureogranulatus]